MSKANLIAIIEEIRTEVGDLQRKLANAVNNDEISDSSYDYAFLHTEEIDIQLQYARLALENR